MVVYAVRAIGCDGSSNTSNIVAALDWVAGNAQLPAIVVMSLGSSTIEAAMDNAVTAVVAAGIVAVTAAGNFNGGEPPSGTFWISHLPKNHLSNAIASLPRVLPSSFEGLNNAAGCKAATRIPWRAHQTSRPLVRC